MTIIDISGNTIQSCPLKNSNGAQQYEIKTGAFAKGLYFVKLSSAEGTSTRKLIVQ